MSTSTEHYANPDYFVATTMAAYQLSITPLKPNGKPFEPFEAVEQLSH